MSEQLLSRRIEIPGASHNEVAHAIALLAGFPENAIFMPFQIGGNFTGLVREGRSQPIQATQVIHPDSIRSLGRRRARSYHHFLNGDIEVQELGRGRFDVNTNSRVDPELVEVSRIAEAMIPPK